VIHPTLRKEEAREKVRQFINERLGEFLEVMSDNITDVQTREPAPSPAS
jgi:hypothetical protein